MGDRTAIAWTDATWNPIRGCSVLSEGCRFCYAKGFAARFSGPGQPYEGLARYVGGRPEWTGKVAFVERHLEDPIRWKKPRRIFVNSMSDLFHENLPVEPIDRIFEVMLRAPQHVYQVLTKRPQRMASYVNNQRLGLEGKLVGELLEGRPNIWLGVSVENQKAAEERVPRLLATRCAVRWLSCEPLLGPVDLRPWLEATGTHIPGCLGTRPCRCENGLRWVVVGGESSDGTHSARPMHPAWARGLLDQCRAGGVAYFFKQWGDTIPAALAKEHGIRVQKYLWVTEDGLHGSRDGWEAQAGSSGLPAQAEPPGERMAVVGKYRDPCTLDGRRIHEYPEVKA